MRGEHGQLGGVSVSVVCQRRRTGLRGCSKVSETDMFWSDDQSAYAHTIHTVLRVDASGLDMWHSRMAGCDGAEDHSWRSGLCRCDTVDHPPYTYVCWNKPHPLGVAWVWSAATLRDRPTPTHGWMPRWYIVSHRGTRPAISIDRSQWVGE